MRSVISWPHGLGLVYTTMFSEMTCGDCVYTGSLHDAFLANLPSLIFKLSCDLICLYNVVEWCSGARLEVYRIYRNSHETGKGYSVS